MPETDAETSTGAVGGVLRIDHVVLAVADIERSARFYEAALGMCRESFEGERTAMRFGEQKLNLVERSSAQAGTAVDLCLVTEDALEIVLKRLAAAGVRPELGPVARTGALGPMLSLYLRDPDGHIVEISSYRWSGTSRASSPSHGPAGEASP